MNVLSLLRRPAACAVLLAFGLAAPVRAEEAPRVTGVVELFTSQGCDACPPADAVLEELGHRPDIVALAYHVDYWDYLGWRDTLGLRENTERQRAYMAALRSRMVYTPQAVVNGRIHLNGSNREGLLRALKEMSLAEAGVVVPLSVTRSGDGFVVAAGPMLSEKCKGIRRADLLLVSFDAPKRVAVDTGENGGRTITYWNPVAGVRAVGLWHGEPARYALPASLLPEGKGAIAILQAVGKDGLPAGPILGAAVIRQAESR